MVTEYRKLNQPWQDDNAPNLFNTERIDIIVNMDEEQAIQRLFQDDISGLEYLVSQYQVKAVRTAYLITRDLGLAEDVVQDSFIRVYRSISSFDQERPFEPWFMRIVVNAAVKMTQRSALHIQLGNETDGSILIEWTRQMESVEALVESNEIQDQLWDSMKRLSPRQRAVLVQRYFLHMSEAEMAARSEVAPGTIKWLLNAARRRLRRLLEKRSAE
jgi:RNA polymerase sigma-70 factor, ECF subfamily